MITFLIILFWTLFSLSHKFRFVCYILIAINLLLLVGLIIYPPILGPLVVIPTLITIILLCLPKLFLVIEGIVLTLFLIFDLYDFFHNRVIKKPVK